MPHSLKVTYTLHWRLFHCQHAFTMSEKVIPPLPRRIGGKTLQAKWRNPDTKPALADTWSRWRSSLAASRVTPPYRQLRLVCTSHFLPHCHRHSRNQQSADCAGFQFRCVHIPDVCFLRASDWRPSSLVNLGGRAGLAARYCPRYGRTRKLSGVSTIMRYSSISPSPTGAAPARGRLTRSIGPLASITFPVKYFWCGRNKRTTQRVS